MTKYKVHYDKAEIIPRLQDWFNVFKKSVNGRLQLLFHIRGDWTLPRHPNCKLKVEHTEKSEEKQEGKNRKKRKKNKKRKQTRKIKKA